MKPKLVRIAVLLVINLLLIAGLYWKSVLIRRQANGFKRFFPGRPIALLRYLDVRFNSYYLAGAHSGKIYLGNETAPLLMLMSDTMLLDTLHRVITKIKGDELRSGRLLVDSIYFYLVDRISKDVYKGSVRDLKAKKLIHSSHIGDLGLPISSNSLIMRTFKEDLPEYILGKQEISPPFFRPADLLENQSEGIFSTDGMLDYDLEKSTLVYLYFYRNEYLSMDTNLHLIGRGHTIDTTKFAKLKIANLKSEGALTLSEPPPVVNLSSFATNGQLFVISSLMADNEDRSVFDDSVVVDVYDLKTTGYRFSFYVPRYKGGKIKNFMILKDRMIAVSNHYLLIYDMSSGGYKGN